MPEVLQSIRSFDKDLPLYDVRSLADLVDENVVTRRLLVVLLSVFAAIALLLAMPGVYGVVAYMVIARRREIGVRLALGAKRRDILRLLLAELLPVILGGAGLGILACLGLSRALGTLLFHISGADPWTIAGSAVLMIAVALAACWIPVRKAMAIDPVTVLHRE